MTERNQLHPRDPLALVGVGCRFPGGVYDTDSLWKMLIEGASAIGEVPEDRWHVDRYHHTDSESTGRMITRRGGFVDQIKNFDAAFWGISPREAKRMDPQQRWLLETAWEACEDAGIAPSKLRGASVGVFVGASSHDYGSLQLNDLANLDVHTNTGGTLSIAANRISYMFDLKGPSIAVDTACSSALVAVSLACRAIWSGECEAALAGGVNALITPNTSIGFSKASMLSPTGECFAFDSRADGYVRGEGAGLVLLKPLAKAIEDNDRIYAVLRSAVVNQDGQTSSMTVPSVAGQSEMLRTAYKEAGVSPQDVAYVEAHGTGTPVGDPIEAEALGRVLSQGRSADDVCWMGSIKTNIGHLESASGVAGLIKAALVLDRKQVPANRNFETPNPAIPLDRYQLSVPTELRPLPMTESGSTLAAVNSFGFGGTNAHVVMQSAPGTNAPSRTTETANRPYVLPISARDESSLQEYAKRYRQRLRTMKGDLADFCTSAGDRKELHPHRLAVIGNSPRELRRRLSQWLHHGKAGDGVVVGHAGDHRDDSVFVFTGQGSQWSAMGRGLIEREPIVRETLEEIDELFQAISGWSLLKEMLLPESESNMQQTRVAQPAIFALQVALVRLWASWGVRPTSVVGHSVGEVAAAWCAGVYSLSDAVSLIYHRSRLQNITGGAGRMLAAGISVQEATEFIGEHSDRVQITAVNSPALVTLGGDTEPLELIGARIESSGRFMRWLGLDYAFHTHQMEPIKDELLASLSHLNPRPARVPFISTVSGTEQVGEQMDAAYWWRNVREPVRFESAIAAILKGGARRFIEVGPHPSLRSSIEACVADQNLKATVTHSISRRTDDAMELATNLAALAIDGVEVDWGAVNQGSGAFVRQPSYPWNYHEHWLDRGNTANRVSAPMHPLLGERLNVAEPTWQFYVDTHLFPYLKDHQIWNGVIFPASGYVEIGLAVAAEMFGDESYAVEDLECKKALFVSDNAVPKVQVVFEQESKSFTVYAASGGDGDQSGPSNAVSWEIHARGRLVALPQVCDAEPIDLDQLRHRLSDRIEHEELYRDLHELGYGFGEEFSLIQEAWSGRTEVGPNSSGEQSLSRIEVSEKTAKVARQYHLHPAVLDACFQATHGTRYGSDVAEDVGQMFLPESVGRVHVHVPEIPDLLWAYAIRTRVDGPSVEYSVRVVDHSGDPVASITRFRVAQVEQVPSHVEAEDHLYQFQWEPQRLFGTRTEGPANLASTNDVIESTKESIPQRYAERGLSDYYNDFVPRIGKIVVQLIENAFVESGWKYQVGENFDAEQAIADLSVDESHARLLRAEFDWLVEYGLLQTHDSGWRVVREPKHIDMTEMLVELSDESPRFASEVALVQATGPRLAEVWSGEIDPLELLFPGGSRELLDRFYTEAGEFSTFNQLLRSAVAKSVESLPPRRVLRVLEIGAGTGSLTRSLLDVLPADRVEYTFTDIGGAFIAEAKRHFSDHSSMRYQTLDIERDPASQGIDPHGYDLIVATNVLHATADLRSTLTHVKSCLASEGMFAFLEVVRPRPIWDNVFGLLEGWWRFSDCEDREGSPLLGRSSWETLLSECGFEDVRSLTCSPNESEMEQAAFFARGAEAVSDDSSQDIVEPGGALLGRTNVVVFVDSKGTGEAIASRFSQRHQRVVTVRRGTSFERFDDSGFTVVDGSSEEIQRVFAESKLDLSLPTKIIQCWTLDNDIENVGCGGLRADQNAGVLSAMQIAHALEEINPVNAPRVYFVTRSAQSVRDEDPVNGLAATPLIGFLRVANNESAAHRWTLVDLDSVGNESEADDVFYEVCGDSDEREIAYRSDHRFVSRLQHVAVDQIPQRRQRAFSQSGEIVPFKLQMEKAGVLENLTLNETVRRSPGPSEIEVRVMAGGINFRDVMKALAMHPGTSEDLLWFGDDFSGVVVAVGSEVSGIECGDRVSGIAPYAFRTHVTVDHRLTFKHSTDLTFEQATTLPTVFLTTHFAINDVARMRRGEKILIHAAAGGVGQAAIQVAKHLGLEVFATAGTPEKRALLHSMGVAHVMNSRTVEFADQVMRRTSGTGVDAVLNSLAGEFIPKSLSVLAPFGRFLEIGKIDVYGNSKVGLAAFKNNISYHMVDLAQIIVEQPDRIASILSELTSLFDSGAYRPLTHQSFPISDVVEAFRFMAQGRHIGKNVLTFPSEPSSSEPLTIGPCTEDGNLLRCDAAYLITGGAGGFGFEIAKWMVSQGARYLVLMSRSGPRDHTVDAIESLRAEGVVVTDARGDVTNFEDVQRVVRQIEDSGHELKGIVHAAMVLDDTFISDLDETRMGNVLYPKMLGAWNLHDATSEMSLDHFVCFSSFSTVVGAAKQANYNAGNSFLDALAQHRRSRGLPALTVNWGALLDAGFVARNEKTAEYLEGIGLKAFRMNEALGVFSEMILRDTSVVGAARVDWKQLGKLSPAVGTLAMYSSVTHDATTNRTNTGFHSDLRDASPSERLEILGELVTQQVAGVFGIDPDKVDKTVSLAQVGIDSLMAVELINRLETATGTRIPVNRILSGPSIVELSRTMLDLMTDLDASDESDPIASDNQTATRVSDEIDFEREAELGPLAITSDASVNEISSPRILLTGASGYLGAHLLSEILTTTESEVVCSVRANDERSGLQRLKDNLENYSLPDCGMRERVRVVTGDFSKSRLGLSADVYDDLGSSVDVIYHNGANVNLALPYGSLKESNVGGTREMLRFAVHGKLKPMHYVSTFTVHATETNRGRVISESDCLPACDELLYGYSQTKWVSERMIEEARERGVPVTIYRPGHVTGHSETGVANTDDLLHNIVRACLMVGAAPFRSLDLDVTPVDYVSRAIVYLAQQPDTLGGTFHLTNPTPLTAEALTQWMNAGGTKVDMVPLEQWQARLLALAEAAELASHELGSAGKTSSANETNSTSEFKLLAEMMMPRLATENDRGVHGRFDCRRTLASLAPSGIVCAPADARLISVCYGYLQHSETFRRIDGVAAESPAGHLNGFVQSQNKEVH